ncbi:MAG: tRNA pseudouridine(38-40) synthase TruA [Candidatus Puniceispirillaceae bacterium]
MQRFFITIEYDGTGLVGWQRQEEGQSVQQFLEEAAQQLTGQVTPIQGSGRTDAGVHATGQVAHLDVPDKFDAKAVMLGINAKLATNQVRITKAIPVSDDAHARFSATSRSYLYKILNRKIAPALHRDFIWHMPYPLDVNAMREGASYLIGKHDFTSFRATACQAKSPVRSIDKIVIDKDGDEIHIAVFAPSFLHHQIRNITGTLAMVGRGKWQPEDVKSALEAKDRRAGGETAPAHGLYLTSINFDEALIARRQVAQ